MYEPPREWQCPLPGCQAAPTLVRPVEIIDHTCNHLRLRRSVAEYQTRDEENEVVSFEPLQQGNDADDAIFESPETALDEWLLDLTHVSR